MLWGENYIYINMDTTIYKTLNFYFIHILHTYEYIFGREKEHMLISSNKMIALILYTYKKIFGFFLLPVHWNETRGVEIQLHIF